MLLMHGKVFNAFSHFFFSSFSHPFQGQYSVSDVKLRLSQ